MDTQKILSSDYLDIIFEGRNKKYGGYELRKTYNRRVFKSFFAIAGICIFVAGYAVVNMSMSRPVRPTTWKPVDSSIHLTIIDHVQPPALPKLPPPPSQPKPLLTTKITIPKVEPDPKVHEKDVPPAQAAVTNPGAKTSTVGDPGTIDPGVIRGRDTAGTGVVRIAQPLVIPTYVQQMPAPPYDLHEYLARNIHYPDAAREANIEGRVSIKFIVDEDGSISSVTTDRGIGGGCDEEARRVVSAMPKWKPGKQNGIPVKVYFTLPVVFKLSE